MMTPKAVPGPIVPAIGGSRSAGGVRLNVPGGLTSQQARVKVEAVGNIFFDLSDANFMLTPGDACPAISGIARPEPMKRLVSHTRP